MQAESDPEDGGSMILRNVDKLLTDYTWGPKIQQYSNYLIIIFILLHSRNLHRSYIFSHALLRQVFVSLYVLSIFLYFRELFHSLLNSYKLLPFNSKVENNRQKIIDYPLNVRSFTSILAFKELRTWHCQLICQFQADAFCVHKVAVLHGTFTLIAGSTRHAVNHILQALETDFLVILFSQT
jgi:hypothetical protein